MIYDGQRRLLAAQASAQLAGVDGYDGLTPVQSLIVLLLDHEPSADEIRRIQAQANQRESLSLVDQQEQLRDCWEARAGLPEPDRIAAVCADLGISPKRAHNLRRQLALPDPIRARVAERPAGEQLSVTMANRLADMHELAPQLTEAVAKRITSTDLHDKALGDMGAFVHRTVVEDEHTYAVRIDDGAMLDAAEQIEHARGHLSAEGRQQIAAILGCELERLDAELDTLAARAKSRALKLRITGDVRDRARNGRYAFVHERGCDFAAGIWIVDPGFMLDLAHEQLGDGDAAPAREEAYFAGARLDDDELRDAAAEDEQRRQRARARHADATRSNLGLGHDIRAGLMDPTDAQHNALRQIACHLLVRHYRELIAYGAGWTDPERQQPVGDTGRHEPHQLDVIIDAELERALADPDPLRGIAQLTARLGRRIRARPRGRHPHQGARLGADRAQAPRRIARRRERAARRHVGVHAADALARARRAQPRRLRRQRERRDDRRPRRPPRRVRPRRARPRRRARLRGTVVPAHRLPSSRPGHHASGREDSAPRQVAADPFFRAVVDPAREVGRSSHATIRANAPPLVALSGFRQGSAEALASGRRDTPASSPRP